MTHNLHVIRPADPHSPDDLDIVRRLDALGNRAFLGPILHGAYPDDLLADTASVTDWSFVHDGDLPAIHQPLDVLGVNYYTTTSPGNGTASPNATGRRPPGRRPTTLARTRRRRLRPRDRHRTQMGWLVDPAGLTELLVRTSKDYPGIPLMVTENGAAYPDVVSPDGRVHDLERTEYVHRHLTPSATPSTPAPTSAATSYGRSSTTSNGPGATNAASASSTSTTPPNAAPSKTPPASTPTSSKPTPVSNRHHQPRRVNDR